MSMINMLEANCSKKHWERAKKKPKKNNMYGIRNLIQITLKKKQAKLSFVVKQ